MTHQTDVTVVGAETSFQEIRLLHPFVISGRTIDWFTLAIVELRVRNRAGVEATGRGATILSVPWSWPGDDMDVPTKDGVLRTITEHCAMHALHADGVDPIAWWLDAEEHLPHIVSKVVQERMSTPVPDLAAMLALGAVDSALHDAWAKAAGLPAMSMYGPDHLSQDLSTVFGPALEGRWPGEFLQPARQHLEVQHLVGANDPLTDAEAADGERSLTEWIRRDGIRHVKVKVHANHPREDARRIVDVHAACQAAGVAPTLAVDPNEGYGSAEDVVTLIEAVRAISPEVVGAITYVEQPVRRGTTPDGSWMRKAGKLVPVLMDEGLTDISSIPKLAAEGWSGVVIKAGKGQSAAVLAHAAACALGLKVMVQDLTAVDLAFVHSARIASVFNLAVPCFEYNSRQYAPDGNRELSRRAPRLTETVGGQIAISEEGGAGLYGDIGSRDT